MGIIEPMAIGSAALSGVMDLGGQGVWLPVVFLLAVSGSGILLSAARPWLGRVGRAAPRVVLPATDTRACAAR